MKTATFEEIAETFDALDDWMDRYQYLIDIGRRGPELSESERIEENRVLGCTSRAWVVPERVDGKLRFRVDSDAAIVKGLLQVVLALYDQKTPGEILALDAGAAFQQLGLDQHLSPSRSNGLRSVVDRIRATAFATT